MNDGLFSIINIFSKLISSISILFISYYLNKFMIKLLTSKPMYLSSLLILSYKLVYKQYFNLNYYIVFYYCNNLLFNFFLISA